MKPASFLPAAALAMSALAPSAAISAPVLWSSASGGNDHYYEYHYAYDNLYGDRASALASSYMGMSGYLATITSAAENAFVYDHVNQSTGYIGGSDEGHEGTWTWLDGPEAGGVFYSTSGGPLDYAYSNWLPGQPDDGYPHGPENALTTNSGRDGWNDVKSFDRLGIGYFVEYGGPTVTGAVPEPASWAMMTMGIGMIGLGLRRRRRQVARLVHG